MDIFTHINIFTYVHFSSKFYGQGPVPSRDHYVGGVSISPSNAVCNLGVIFGNLGFLRTL